MLPEQLHTAAAGLTLIWPEHTQHYPWFWLRDHGEDPASLDPQTQQRKIDTFTLAPDIQATAVHWDKATAQVHFVWPDGAKSYISTDSLARVAGVLPASAQLLAGNKQILWSATHPLDHLPNHLPSISCPEILASDAGVRHWLELIAQYGFAVVTAMQPTEQATVELAERIAPAQHTIFGPYWPLSAEIKAHEDSAYTTEFLAPHTDGTYYHDPAGLQLFNCIEFDGQGGESTLVDGFALARQLQATHPDYYAVLTQVLVPAHYREPGVHLAAEHSVLRLDRHGALAQVAFNNYDRSPFLLPAAEQALFYAAYAEFNRLCMQQENWIRIPLRPGMALIFDNWRCLHGRMNYIGKRYFYGCYHARADFDSRVRVLRAG